MNDHVSKRSRLAAALMAFFRATRYASVAATSSALRRAGWSVPLSKDLSASRRTLKLTQHRGQLELLAAFHKHRRGGGWIGHGGASHCASSLLSK